MKCVFVFGDSITYGCWDLEEGGWVNRLRKFLEGRYDNDVLVYNLGVSANKTVDLLKRAKFEIESRIKEKDINEVTILYEIGLNDSQYVINKGHRVPIDDFRKNIESLINIGQNYGKVLFVGLTPVDESKTIPLSWDKSKIYKNEFIRKYDKVIRETCKKREIPYIPIFDEMQKVPNFENELIEDGLHPSSKGHELIFKIVRNHLIKFLDSDF